MLVIRVERNDTLKSGVRNELRATPAYITRCVDRTTKSVRTIANEESVGLRMDRHAVGVGDECICSRSVDSTLTEA
jgi:hypothetical protein